MLAGRLNVGLGVYPQCVGVGGPIETAAGPIEGADDYPPCTRQVKDRCVQAYTRWTNRR